MIGPRADSVVRDWYGGQAPYVVTPRQGIAAKLPAANILYAADDTGGAAVAAAAASDVAVVFVGNHPTCGANASWGTCPTHVRRARGGRPNVHRARAVAADAGSSVVAANPRTIVVLVSSFPIAIDWINDTCRRCCTSPTPARSWATRSPTCSSATTTRRTHDHHLVSSEADIPTAITDYDIREGTTYWYFTGTPLYPFGYGLSYSTFAYRT